LQLAVSIPNPDPVPQGTPGKANLAPNLPRQPFPDLTTNPVLRDSNALAARLRFSRFDERFCEKSWQWLNDPEIKQLTMTPDFTREGQLRWFARLPEMKDYMIWGLSFEEVPIGAAGLKKITRNDGEYWGYIGERRYWGLGLGRQIVRFVLNEARALKLREVFLRVHRDNFRAVTLYAGSGLRCAFP